MLNPNGTSKTDNVPMPTFQPMGLGGILDATLSLYRKNLRLFLGIAAVDFILTGLKEGVIVFLLERSNTETFENFISDVDHVSGTFISILIIGVSIAACSELYLGRYVTIQIALRRFSSRFMAYLDASWLYLILCVVWTLESLGGLLISLLRFVSLPFLCFYLVSWVLYGPVVLNEEFTADQEALGRSKMLVQGTWGRVFGIVLALLLFCLAISYILGSSLGVVLALFGIVRDGSLMETVISLFGFEYIADRPTSMVSLIIYLIYRGAEAFTLPIYAIGVTLLYFDVRIRKEAFDIEMQLRNSQDLM